MKLRRLHLKAFGPFTDRVLDFGTAGSGLVLVHDYCAFGMSGVIPAVDAYTHCHKIDPWFVTRDMEPTAFWQRGTEKAGLGS